MSFRDSAVLKAAENCNTPGHCTTEINPGVRVTLSTDSVVTDLAGPHVATQSALTSSPRGLGATESANPPTTAAASSKRGAPDECALLSPRVAVAPWDIRSDATGVRSTANRPGSSCYGSARSSGKGVGQISSRIIYPSAPITFTKALSPVQQWGAYTRTRAGYLDAEAVRAAAAADETMARSQAAELRTRDKSSSSIRERNRGKSRGHSVEETGASPHEGELQAVEGHSAGMQRSQAAAVPDAGSAESQLPLEVASFRQTDSAVPEDGHRASLGNWIFGGGESGTEIERVLKEESDLAEAAAARRELVARKLMQEDMEAMIGNLQQVSGSDGTAWPHAPSSSHWQPPSLPCQTQAVGRRLLVQ